MTFKRFCIEICLVLQYYSWSENIFKICIICYEDAMWSLSSLSEGSFSKHVISKTSGTAFILFLKYSIDIFGMFDVKKQLTLFNNKNSDKDFVFYFRVTLHSDVVHYSKRHRTEHRTLTTEIVENYIQIHWRDRPQL